MIKVKGVPKEDWPHYHAWISGMLIARRVTLLKHLHDHPRDMVAWNALMRVYVEQSKNRSVVTDWLHPFGGKVRK